MENISNEFTNETGSPLSKFNKKIVFYVIGFFVFLIVFYSLFLSAPGNFPLGNIIRIEKGSSLRSISFLLKNQNIIRSRVAFESFVIMLGGEKHIISSDYLFENKLSVWSVAKRIVDGEHHMAPVSVTIPEGFNLNQIADTFVSKLTNFNKTKFLLKAEKLEG